VIFLAKFRYFSQIDGTGSELYFGEKLKKVIFAKNGKQVFLFLFFEITFIGPENRL